MGRSTYTSPITVHTIECMFTIVVYCVYNHDYVLSVSPSLPLPLSFSPLCSLIWHGWHVALEYKDLTDLNREDKSGVVDGKFQRSWEAELQRTG